VLFGLPLAVTLAAAVGVGLGFSSAGSCVRARWSYRLRSGPLLNTAFAFEAVVDEAVFIVGPVLATFLATTVHPALGVVACVVLGLTGALALASMRDTQPPLTPKRHPSEAKPPLSARLLLPIVLTCVGLGALFGGMELVIVAFADEAGIPRYTGVIVMVWAAGSLVAGLLTGAVAWRSSPARRFRIGAMLLAVSVVPLPFTSDPVLVTLLLLISGIFIAPTLIASTAVIQELVPSQRLTEAMGWTSMGLAAGVAAGAAGLGLVIDSYDAQAGFWAVVGIGVLLILAALNVRTPRPQGTEALSAPLGAAGPVTTDRLPDLERS
jgi:predicted MFS family arabinose efflux permease